MRRTGRRITAAFLPSIALTVLGLAAVAVEHLLSGNMQRAWAVGFPVHAGWFACGMASATLGFLVEQGRLRPPAHWRTIAVVAGLGLTAASMKLHTAGVLSRVDYQWPVAIALGLLLLIVVLAEDGSRLRSLLGSRILVAAGLASYSIFLVHDPIIRELRTHELISSGWGGFLLALVLVGAATAIAATLSYRLLERPSFALKRRLTRPVAEGSARPEGPALAGASTRRSWLPRRKDRRLPAVLARLVAEVQPARADGFRIEAGEDAEVPVDTDALEPVVVPLLRNALRLRPASLRDQSLASRGRARAGDRGQRQGSRPAVRAAALRAVRAQRALEAAPRPRGLGLTLARRSARGASAGTSSFYLPRAEPGARFAITLPLEPVQDVATRVCRPRGGLMERTRIRRGSSR